MKRTRYFGLCQGIPVDTHVINAAEKMGWIVPTTNSEQVRAQLESWVPKLLWYDFNEVFGSLGQMSVKTELRSRLRSYLSRDKYSRIAHEVGRLMDGGQGIARIESVQPVAKIVAGMIEDARAILTEELPAKVRLD